MRAGVPAWLVTSGGSLTLSVSGLSPPVLRQYNMPAMFFPFPARKGEGGWASSPGPGGRGAGNLENRVLTLCGHSCDLAHEGACLYHPLLQELLRMLC